MLTAALLYERRTARGWRTAMAHPEVKAATSHDEAATIGVLTLAFSTDPVARWQYPDPADFLMHFPSFARAFGGRGFDCGSACYVEGYKGAALWLPPGTQPDELAMRSIVERTVDERKRDDLFGFLQQMEAYHPKEPHWYLPLVGVDPIHQGHGYGAALMQPALANCDRDRTLAYLESSNPSNIPFYQRHGFEVLGTCQAGTSPTFAAMLRKPR